jgi:hypothetical protein
MPNQDVDGKLKMAGGALKLLARKDKTLNRSDVAIWRCRGV